MYRYSYDLKYSDYKDFDTVKVGSVLDIIQEAAIRNSEDAGFGIEKLKDNDRAWLLQGINIRFNKPVSRNFPVDAYTAVKSIKGVLSERGCLIMQNGEIVAESIANWCLLDTKKMRLARASKEMIDSYEHYDFNDEFFSYIRPQIIENAGEIFKIRVSNKELDTNKHLNNQKGAEILMDALPYDFDIKSMRIYYPNPAYLGDILSVCTERTKSGIYVHLKNQKNAVCVAAEFEGR